MPSTINKCGFMRRGAPCDAKVTQPGSHLIVEKLPQSTKEGEYRIARDEKRNATEGLDVRYDVWGGNKEKRKKLL